MVIYDEADEGEGQEGEAGSAFRGLQERRVGTCRTSGFCRGAKDLGLAQSQLYGWRQIVKGKANVSVREQDLATEVARLKRQVTEQTEELSILKKASAYFARHQK